MILQSTALITLGATNAFTKLSKDKGNSAGCVLALTIGGALFNKLPFMVGRLRLVLGRGVWTMKEQEKVICGDCLRSDCIHLEEARA